MSESALVGAIGKRIIKISLNIRTVGPVSQLLQEKRGNPISLEHEKSQRHTSTFFGLTILGHSKPLDKAPGGRHSLSFSATLPAFDQFIKNENLLTERVG